MLHVKNLYEENMRAKIQDQHDRAETVVRYDRVYNPERTIEFDRNGEALLYSCEPFKYVSLFEDVQAVIDLNAADLNFEDYSKASLVVLGGFRA